MKQASFLPPVPREHGGLLGRNKRKSARPLDPKRPLHLVLRSSRARGPWSMLHPRHRARVERLVREIARKHGVRLYRFANVGNHLHLLLLAPTRIGFRRFLREMPGAIAMAVTGARKGAAAGRFWDYLPFTRIADWGRDFRNLRLYFVKNLFEAAGLLSRKARADGLRVIPIAGWGVGPPG